MNNSPIFLGCQPRGGTSLLRTMLGKHPNIYGGDGFETNWFSDEMRDRWKNNKSRRQNWLQEWYGVSEKELLMIKDKSDSGIDFFNHFMNFCTKREGKSRWIEKTPDNLRHFKLIFEYWPNAKFIHGIRDFRDVYASWKSNNLGSLRNIEVNEFVERVQSSYHQIEHLLGKKKSNYLETKYEDLVIDPKNTITNILNFLNEPFVEGIEFYEGNSEELEKVQKIIKKKSSTSISLTKPIFNSSIGRWEKILSNKEVAIIENELGNISQKLGY